MYNKHWTIMQVFGCSYYDEAEFYFDDNVKISDKKWVSLKKLIKNKNINKKDCILLPFKTLKKIVSTWIMGNLKQSFLAGLFSIITIGILTFLTLYFLDLRCTLWVWQGQRTSFCVIAPLEA